MWCDIYLVVFSYQRGDSSMFYTVPQGEAISVQKVLEIEERFKEKYSYHRPLVRFERLDAIQVDAKNVGRILDRKEIESVIKP